MILLIDNYDSFSYNLYQLIATKLLEQSPNTRNTHSSLKQHAQSLIQVVRNDAISIEQIKHNPPQAIIISPGPKAPKDAGICIDAICEFAPYIPILGVCLGHQAICEAFGGRVGLAPKLMHGKTDTIAIDTTSPLFATLDSHIQVARYHSLCALTLPDELEAKAHTLESNALESNTPESTLDSTHNNPPMIMALQHKSYPTYGVQFHPESILTPQGATIIQNFLAITRDFHARHCSHTE